MGIRSRILLLQLIVIGSVLMMAAIVYTTIRLTSHDMQRVQWANKQLEAITALTVREKCRVQPKNGATPTRGSRDA